MDVLVTGGNGFVGRHLVQALRERGDSVRVLALPSENTSWLEQRGIAVYRGDVRDQETLLPPMRGVKAVFHLAAMMDVWRPLHEYRAVNVTGTQNVCNAALAADVHRLIHMSSSSVYGMGLRLPADETFPLRPFRDPYPMTKAEGDMLVHAMMRDHRLPAVVIRPDQIFGPGDHLHFGQMADRLRAGKSIIVGSGRNAMPFVFVTDVVNGLLLALDHPRALGRTYNITNDHPMTQAGFLSAIAHEIGVTPPSLHVPYGALYAAAYVAESIAAISGTSRRPPITRLGVAFFGTHNRYAIDKARMGLGYIPRVELRDGVRLTAAWYRQQLAQVPVDAPVSAGTPGRLN